MNKSEYEKCFEDCVVDVIFTMTGFEVQEDKTFIGEFDDESNIYALMFIKGKKDYVMSISMSEETAMITVSYMTGILPEDIKKDDLKDGICELLNMICGKAKTQLRNTVYQFTQTLPLSVTGENISINYKTKHFQVLKRFLSGNMEIYFKIVSV